MNYYNEFDEHAAAWLRELVSRGLIPHGDVDSRNIRDVKPAELAGYTQCHFFAGIGGWPLALSLAGWPADRPVWTGSCPCQPFSAAGKRKGTADDRHLWPDFARLIGECAPAIVFGEQVASRDGREWLASVRDDLETMGYAVGAADLCAPGAGAYHIRQRLFFGASRLGNANNAGSQGRVGSRDGADQRATWSPGVAGGLEYPASDGRQQRRTEPNGRKPGARCVQDGSGMAVTDCGQRGGIAGGKERQRYGATAGRDESDGKPECSSAIVDWRDAEWIECSDGKARPIEPGAFPLAYGIPARVVRLRGYGNAIVPQVAATFVKAFAESVTP